jgi:hypothetical protein
MGDHEPGNRNSGRGARHKIQHDEMTKADRLQLPALFATDADIDAWALFMSGIDSHFHQLADALGFQHLEPRVGYLNFNVLSPKPLKIKIVFLWLFSRNLPSLF